MDDVFVILCVFVLCGRGGVTIEGFFSVMAILLGLSWGSSWLPFGNRNLVQLLCKLLGNKKRCLAGWGVIIRDGFINRLYGLSASFVKKKGIGIK